MQHLIKIEWVSETLGTPILHPDADSEPVRFTGRDISWGTLLADLNGDSELGLFRVADGSTDEEKALKEITCKAYRELLRFCVDEWLESGFSRDRALEEPIKRRLSRLDEMQNRFCDTEASRLMQLWLDTHPRRVCVYPTGELYFEERKTEERDSWSADERAKDAAGRTLISLMSDRRKWTLSKCALCGEYYVREKPREYYKRQTYCASCRGRATAMRRMKEKRQVESDQLMRSAIDAFTEWSKLKESTRKIKFKGDPRAFIAGKIQRFGRTRTWVSRNFAEIEKKSEELK